MTGRWNERTRRDLIKGGALAAAGLAASRGTLATAQPATPAQPAVPGVVVREGGELRIGFGDLSTVTLTRFNYFGLFHDYLVVADRNTGDLSPQLAESWSWNPDATELRITLRPGLTWHDGTLVTADDVVFTFGVNADLRFAYPNYVPTFSRIAGYAEVRDGQAPLLSGVSKADELTVTVAFTEPDPSFLRRFAGRSFNLLPNHLLGRADRETIRDNPFWRQQVGTGPFRWVEFEPDRFLIGERFDGYWKGPAKLDAVRLLPTLDPAATLAALEAGEVDVINDVPTEDALRLQDVSGVRPIGFWSGRAQSIIVNHNSPRVPNLGDPRFKRAMMYAIDRETIVDALLGGEAGGRPWFHNLMPEWAHHPDGHPYRFDPDMARSLLDEMGWDSSQQVLFSFGSDDLAAAVQQYLSDVGINVTSTDVDPVTGAALREDGDFDMFKSREGYLNPPEDQANDLLCAAAPPNGGNTAFYCNAEADAVWEEILVTTDEETRVRLFQELDRLYLEYPVWIPIFMQRDWWAVRDTVALNEDLIVGNGRQHLWGFAAEA
jgi:peptide/nickel transport system substrate-binding protein